MSNNKLYTEEQVRNLLNEILMLSSSVEDAMNSLTPIELPSDEEIWKEANKEENLGSDFAFARGAEFLKNKIQGGNK